MSLAGHRNTMLVWLSISNCSNHPLPPDNYSINKQTTYVAIHIAIFFQSTQLGHITHIYQHHSPSTMPPPANETQPQRGYHHRFQSRRKRQRVPSTPLASPSKRPRAPLGELQDTAANEVRGPARSPGKSALKDFEESIQPLAGVPAWLLEDRLKLTDEICLDLEDGAD